MKSDNGELSKKLIAGGVAGVIGTTCIYPIDYIKTRLQNQHQKTPLSQLPAFIRTLYQRTGLRGFYSGLGANLIGVTPEKAIKLTVNDLVRMKLSKSSGRNESELPWYLGIIAGGTAGACQILATTPMEMAKIQLQMQTTSSNSKLKLIRELGIRGLYRGFGATFMRDVPFSFIFFPTHAFLKSELNSSLGAGLGAGAIASFLVTPMDVVKTRLQTANNPQLSMIHVYRDILKKESPMALFKGSLQRCMIVAPLFGISLKVYDLMK